MRRNNKEVEPNPPPRTKKLPSPSTSGLPRVLDRQCLLDLIEALAELPEGISEKCLAALADQAFKDREKVNAYYEARRARALNATRKMEPFPIPDYRDIEPDF